MTARHPHIATRRRGTTTLRVALLALAQLLGMVSTPPANPTPVEPDHTVPVHPAKGGASRSKIILDEVARPGPEPAVSARDLAHV